MSLDYCFHRIKVSAGGEGGTGKSSIIRRYCDESFLNDYEMSIGIDTNFLSKELIINNEKLNISLWDFGGQERFRFLIPGLVKCSSGMVYVLDLTRINLKSYESELKHINEWIATCEQGIGKEVPSIILGNKIDLLEEVNNIRRVVNPLPDVTKKLRENKRIVGMPGADVLKHDEITNILNENPLTEKKPFFEVSAKTGINVKNAFYVLGCMIAVKIHPKEINTLEKQVNPEYKEYLNHWASEKHQNKT